MEIISKEQAVAAGKSHYFTGKPCKKGHIEPRTVSRRSCMGCLREQSLKWRSDNPEKAKSFRDKYYKNNKDRLISYSSSRKVERKLRAVEYKGGKCQRCGYSAYYGALEFHHRDPSQKDFTIGHVNRKWDNIVAELDKCDLLCANCHREVEGGFVCD